MTDFIRNLIYLFQSLKLEYYETLVLLYIYIYIYL